MFTSCSRSLIGSIFGVLMVALLAGVEAATPLAAQTKPDGRTVFLAWCAGCHGDQGDGEGDAARYLLPRPRNLTLGVYKFRSTPSGEVPTDADLRRTVDDGVLGTPMVGWRDRLSQPERDAVLGYIKTLSPFFSEPAPKPVQIGKPPAVTPESVADGRKTYETLRCFECHGQAGRGDGTSVPTFTDDAKFPIPASDLTEGWKFKGGTSVEQIYARLYTGLDGTPMPSFGAQVEAGAISEQQLWHLAQYVRSLSSQQPPEVSPMLHVPAITTPLPASPEDPAWDAIEPHYVPLGGQLIVKPRWFAPAVDGIWVRAVHDGKRLALKLTWHDPSRSPDPAFDPWLERLGKALPTVDGPVPTKQGPDRVYLTFPVKLQPDSLRPYFLSGDTQSPAYVWRWRSDSNAVAEGLARGLTRFAPRARPEVAHAARYQDGEWQLQLSRPLTPSDSTATTFLAGQPLAVAFFLADGSNGEVDTRGAIAGWYMLHLEDAPSQATAR